MMQKYLSLVLLFLLLSASALAQRTGRNLSLQAGYQFKLLSPNAYNFIIDDIFNMRSPLPVSQFERITWTPGLSFGIGYHQRKINLTAFFAQYSGSTMAIADDSLGTELQWASEVKGWDAGISFVSELVPFADNGGIYVGGAFQITNFTTTLATAPSGEALPAFEDITNNNKASFNVTMPIRYGPIPQFQLAIEPYYQVFFSPLNLRRFSNTLNGEARTADFSGGVISELDHFGVTAKLIVFLIPRT